MRVTFNGQQLDFATGSILADKEAWDVQTNNSIRNVRSQMITSFKYFEANDTYPTSEQLSAKFKERMTGVVPKKPEPKKRAEVKPKEPDFFVIFDEFMSDNEAYKKRKDSDT